MKNSIFLKDFKKIAWKIQFFGKIWQTFWKKVGKLEKFLKKSIPQGIKLTLRGKNSSKFLGKIQFPRELNWVLSEKFSKFLGKNQFPREKNYQKKSIFCKNFLKFSKKIELFDANFSKFLTICNFSPFFSKIFPTFSTVFRHFCQILGNFSKNFKFSEKTNSLGN